MVVAEQVLRLRLGKEAVAASVVSVSAAWRRRRLTGLLKLRLITPAVCRSRDSSHTCRVQVKAGYGTGEGTNHRLGGTGEGTGHRHR